MNGSKRAEVGAKYQNISNISAAAIDAGDSIHSQHLNPEQYQTSKLMMANEHITMESFNALIPKESHFEANENNEDKLTYEKDGQMHSNIHMNDKQDVAKINKAFLKNIGVMLPRIMDP